MTLEFLKLLAFSSLLSINFSGHSCVVANETNRLSAFKENSEESVPSVTEVNGSWRLTAPDWSKITWSNLPPVSTSGSISFPPTIVNKIGYDPSRSWLAGQNLEEIIKLGDIEDAFEIGDLSLKNISTLVPIEKKLTLSAFGLMKWQTVESLVKAIPSLGDLNVTQVKPIQDLFTLVGINDNGSLAQIVQSNPKAANLSLDKLDLSQYFIDSIPMLTSTKIDKFKDWRRSTIGEVPGLNQIPFDKMPQPISDGNGVIGVASLVLGEAEHGDPMVGSGQFISGRVNSNDVTVSVPCNVDAVCSYLELGDLAGSSGALYGKRWVSGSSQKVKGGFGILANVNGGLEPTGRLVYGSAFKVVLTGVNESTGTADFGLFFRLCTHIPFSGKTCTPYFIGPVPWIPVKEKDLVIVGTGQ
ncbi:MAG: hypothetical protein KME28_22065 [Pelatocladus maniniholoensis HA4357-MV3]|jgi:hypothetical protein|uniref:Uncharacterized protein n=1 Tax=Pelatocladus maniniholoensis HA4357-MV3 TaxID=1117104 RepID=A0A9E3LVE7_9NOST|nr:hypothetical protein [Pelatocladus maniniholoensis HA4357-MV3]